MKLLHALGAIALGVASLNASAETGRDFLSKQCIACHAITKPDNASLDRLLERKGPDLYYAGSKFNKEWLEAWLQNPTVLRPAGVMYAKNVVGHGDSVDTIDDSKFEQHLKLSKEDAALATEALMALKAESGLIEEGAFKNGPVNAKFSAMLFGKLRGCTSCHAAKPDDGIASGPELYDAGNRLQADFVYAYIKNPQKFDPHIWMPNLNLNEADLQKLTGYISTLKSAEKK